jgi:ABC-type branched-subunit amino acid transport system substrate-binding protein
VRAGVRVVGSRRFQREARGLGRAAVIGAAMVALAGCGLRVGSSEVRAANQAALSGGGLGGGTAGGGVAGSGAAGSGAAGGSGGVALSGASGSGGALTGGTAGTGGTGGSAIGGTGGSGSGSVSDSGTGGVGGGGGGGSSGGGGGTGGSGSATTAAGCANGAPAGGNGGATDTGVTATTITVGNVSDLGGPVPGLFQGGPAGTQAYINYVNSQGGICGRKLKLVTSDDSLECNQNEADYQNLENSVFAFVGGWSLDDSCGAQILSHHTPIPVVQQALSIQFQALPGTYGVDPLKAGAQTGYFDYFKQKFPDAISSVGTLVGNQPSAVQSWQYYKQVMEGLGYKVTYEDDFPPAQSNFTADVIRMKAQGVKMVFIIAVNAPDLAAFSQEAAQQGWKPELFVAPIGYFGQYISDSGGASAVNGQYIPVVQARFLGEDASTVPEVGLFDQWMKSTAPNIGIDQFADTSWANTALFVQALKMVGPHVTRAAVIAALSQIHSFSDNGMFPTVDVGSKTAANCYLLLQIQNGQYVKVDDPPTGFRCDGTFVPYH